MNINTVSTSTVTSSNVRVSFTRISKNTKTGPISVSSTSAASCPVICPLKKNGCYAETSYTGINWRRLDNVNAGLSWDEYCQAIKALPKKQKIRHSVAGDLPHNNEYIDAYMLGQLVAAMKNKHGFTYTHHNMSKGDNAGLVRSANRDGFTVNLSANSMDHADDLKRLNAGPVVCMMPIDCDKVTQTKAGNTVIQCPATYLDDIDCSKCMICANATRKAIIGFPVHGARKNKAQKIINIYSIKG